MTQESNELKRFRVKDSSGKITGISGSFFTFKDGVLRIFVNRGIDNEEVAVFTDPIACVESRSTGVGAQ